jgi:hypothetical protein
MRQLVILMRIQSFELANKPAFRNCLVTMRPKTTKEDLPSAYDVKAFLRKEFVRHIEGLAAEIQVCPLPRFFEGELWNSPYLRASLDVHR